MDVCRHVKQLQWCGLYKWALTSNILLNSYYGHTSQWAGMQMLLNTEPVSALMPLAWWQERHPACNRVATVEKNSQSFPGFSRAINLVNLLFHRLSQQKVNAIMTFVKGDDDPFYPVNSRFTQIFELWTKNTLFVTIFPRLHRIPWEFPELFTFREILEYSRFVVTLCKVLLRQTWLKPLENPAYPVVSMKNKLVKQKSAN